MISTAVVTCMDDPIPTPVELTDGFVSSKSGGKGTSVRTSGTQGNTFYKRGTNGGGFFYRNCAKGSIFYSIGASWHFEPLWFQHRALRQVCL